MTTNAAIEEVTFPYFFTSNLGFNIYKKIVITVLVFGVLSYLSFTNFLLFHCIVELICISIGILIIVIVINTYPFGVNSGILILGIAYGFISVFDGLHMLSYKGMGVIGNSVNLSTQLWIIARCMESISILISIYFFNKKTHFRLATFIYLIVSMLLILSLFVWRVFPDCYIEGIGLTDFKINSEYIISEILLVSAFLMSRNKHIFKSKTYTFIMLSVLSTVISELFFTFYIDVYDISSIIGHDFKLISFYFIYKAIIEANIKAPHEELEKSEKMYRILLDTIPTGVVIHSKGKIQLANNAFINILGLGEYCSGEVIHTSIWDYFDTTNNEPIDDEHIDNLREDLEKSSSNMYFKEKLIRRDGTYLDVLVSVIPYTYENEPATLITIKDITPMIEAEVLKSQIEEKTIEQKLQRDFFANLSHELKTPINLIFSTVQLLETNFKMLLLEDEHMRKYMKILRQNCYRMLRLINNLIDVTKMDSGYLKLSFKNCNIINVVEDIVLSTAEYIHSRGINLLFDTDVEEKFMAVDPAMIERIILNLLSNAIKFTDKEGEIVVNIEDRVDHIIISVKDSGVGIPKDKQDLIFDRFGQVDKTLARNTQGSGIGLCLVQSLVRMHGGDISVKSEYKKGSEFIITLPVTLLPEDENPFIYENKERDKYVEMINIEFSDIYLIS